MFSLVVVCAAHHNVLLIDVRRRLHLPAVRDRRLAASPCDHKPGLRQCHSSRGDSRGSGHARCAAVVEIANAANRSRAAWRGGTDTTWVIAQLLPSTNDLHLALGDRGQDVAERVEAAHPVEDARELCVIGMRGQNTILVALPVATGTATTVPSRLDLKHEHLRRRPCGRIIGLQQNPRQRLRPGQLVGEAVAEPKAQRCADNRRARDRHSPRQECRAASGAGEGFDAMPGVGISGRPAARHRPRCWPTVKWQHRRRRDLDLEADVAPRGPEVDIAVRAHRAAASSAAQALPVDRLLR